MPPFQVRSRLGRACLISIATCVWAMDPAALTAAPAYVQLALTGIDAPETPEALVKNFKLAVQQDAFLTAQFYTTPNIQRTFGEYPLQWAADEPRKKYLEIDRTASPLVSSHPTHDCLSGAVVSWLMKAGEQVPLGKAQIALGFKYADPRCAVISIDLIRNLFGEPTRTESIFSAGGLPNPHRDIVMMRTTHPLGNSDVEYTISEKPVSRRLRLEVLGNGVVRHLHFYIEEY